MTAKRNLLPGYELSPRQEEVLIVIWQACELGINPDFTNPEYRSMRAIAMKLAHDAVVVKWCPVAKEFTLTKDGEWLANFLFDSYGLMWGDLIPKRKK